MTPIDAQARTQALDYRHSYIVQAPAGSGKTSLLVGRILSLLQTVEKPEEILAITFTRKATSEMRERVIDALARAKNEVAFEAHEQSLRVLAQAVLARDAKKNWQLLSQPNRLKLQTIDALCSELVRKMPWSSRFGGMPQLETDIDSLYAQAARNLVQKIDQAKYQSVISTLLVHCNGNVQTLQTNLASALRTRNDWLQLIFSDKALTSRTQIEQNWQQLVENSLSEIEQYLGRTMCDELLALARYASDNLAESSDARRDALYTEPNKAWLQEKSIQWQMILSILTTNDGIRKPGGINKNIGFPTKDEAKTKLQAIVKELGEDTKIYPLLEGLKRLPTPTLTDSEWERLCALREALPLLTQELYVVMAERNCADYDELALRAIDALGAPDNPTDLALIQDYSLRHILMDEFQDTSPTQLRLLERLTAGWQKGDGRTLFLVGDPMQSIYAFRGGDVRVFLSVRDNGINDIALSPLSLEVNFRSSPRIIEWVNSVMPSVFPREDQPQLARVKYTASTPNQTFHGGVSYHLCVSHKPQRETAEIVKLIQSLTEQNPDEEITVLARKRAPLEQIALLLRKSNINFESIELETLAEQMIVQDLISLSSIFLQPLDTLAWLSVCRAPWCGMSLNDLTILREQALPMIELVNQKDTNLRLSDEGKHALLRLNKALSPALMAKDSLSLSDRIINSWLALRAPACYSEQALSHADYFFELFASLESKPTPITHTYLLEQCAKQKISTPSSNIKLMTFHKAKGLEFDHVILVGLASKSGGDNRNQPMLNWAQLDNRTLIAPSARRDEPTPTKANFIKQTNQIIGNEEQARLFYVAATRAKKQLYLFASLKRSKQGLNPQKGSLLALLWPELDHAFESSPYFVEDLSDPEPNTPKKTTRRGVALQSLPRNLPNIALPTSIGFVPEANQPQSQNEHLAFDWAQEQARVVGLAAHQLFQFSDLKTVREWQNQETTPAARTTLTRFGLSGNQLNIATQRLSKLLRNTASDATAHWLFNPDHQDVHKEWALSCEREGKVFNYVIDHSFVDEDNTRWIVDFKTSSHSGADIAQFIDQEVIRYTPQLQQYASLVQALEPTREIKLGLYFPALSAWREI